MMLAFLVAATVLGQAADALLGDVSLADLPNLAKSIGYELTLEKGRTYGVMKRTGHRGVLDVGVGTNKSEAVGLWLNLKFDVNEPTDVRVPDKPLERWPQDESIQFTPHIGNTVTVSAYVGPLKGRAPSQLKARFDSIWDSTEVYVKQHHGKMEPISRRNLDHAADFADRIIGYPDLDSLQFLIDAWGWSYKKGWGASGNGWVWPLNIEGVDYWIRQSFVPSKDGETQFNMLATFEKVSPSSLKMLDTNKSQYPWAVWELSYKTSEVVGCTSIILTPKTTVADVKKQMLTFAKHVELLDKVMRSQ